MSLLTSSTGLALPALRGRQGDRTIYLVLPTNNVLNTFFTAEMEPVDDRSQRPLDPKHAAKIGDYIVANPRDYLLGAITYAVDVVGTFDEVEPGTGIGVLHLPLTARLRSVDGQHRRRGLKHAIDVVDAIGGEHTALLIYVESDLAKRKQMFSDMNNTARVVPKTLNVAYDSRDPFARAVNTLIAQHPLLAGRVETEAARVKPGTDALYTLGGVHDVSKRLFVGQDGRVREPGRFDEQEILTRVSSFFDLLQKARPEFAAAADADTLDALRSSTILFSSTTLRVLAGAVYECVWKQPGGDDSLDFLIDPLAAVDFAPGDPVWRASGLVSPGKATPVSRLQEVRAATHALARRLTAA